MHLSSSCQEDKCFKNDIFLSAKNQILSVLRNLENNTDNISQKSRLKNIEHELQEATYTNLLLAVQENINCDDAVSITVIECRLHHDVRKFYYITLEAKEDKFYLYKFNYFSGEMKFVGVFKRDYVGEMVRELLPISKDYISDDFLFFFKIKNNKVIEADIATDFGTYRVNQLGILEEALTNP